MPSDSLYVGQRCFVHKKRYALVCLDFGSTIPKKTILIFQGFPASMTTLPLPNSILLHGSILCVLHNPSEKKDFYLIYVSDFEFYAWIDQCVH